MSGISPTQLYAMQQYYRTPSAARYANQPQVQQQPQAVVVQDASNDGEFSFLEAGKNFGKEFWNSTAGIVTNIIKHPIQSALGAAVVIGGVALASAATGIAAATIGTGLLVVGGAWAAGKAGVGIFNAARHWLSGDGDAAEKDFGTIGSGAGQAAMTAGFMGIGRVGAAGKALSSDAGILAKTGAWIKDSFGLKGAWANYKGTAINLADDVALAVATKAPKATSNFIEKHGNLAEKLKLNNAVDKANAAKNTSSNAGSTPTYQEINNDKAVDLLNKAMDLQEKNYTGFGSSVKSWIRDKKVAGLEKQINKLNETPETLFAKAADVENLANEGSVFLKHYRMNKAKNLLNQAEKLETTPSVIRGTYLDPELTLGGNISNHLNTVGPAAIMAHPSSKDVNKPQQVFYQTVGNQITSNTANNGMSEEYQYYLNMLGQLQEDMQMNPSYLAQLAGY